MARRASFTLLEILVCLTLVAVAIGTCTLSVPKLLEKQRFEHEVEGAIVKIIAAQEKMLNLSQDVVLPTSELRGAHIEQVYLDGRGIDTLQFETLWNRCPQGTLTLMGKKRRAEISLLGYPGKVSRGTYEKKQESHISYPQTILSAP